MALIHGEFFLPIYLAEVGETPKPGAFFATAKGSNLSKIAKAAYGDSSAWKVINSNAWNMANCVYRADSTDCNSSKRDATWAKTTLSPTTSAHSAYISLCQRDAKQIAAAIPATNFKYPVIWIPDMANMPMPVNVVKPEEKKEEPELKPVVVAPGPWAPKTTPINPTTPKKSTGGTVVVPKTTPDIIPAEEASMKPWWLLGLGVVALIGVLVWPEDKGGSKKSSKSGSLVKKSRAALRARR